MGSGRQDGSVKLTDLSSLYRYVFDYLIIIVLAGFFYALDAVEPYHQHFALQNYTLQYPYAVHERVSIPLVLICAAGVPIIIIAVYTLFIDGIYSHREHEVIRTDEAGLPERPRRRGSKTSPYTWSERLWELNCGVLGILLAQGAAFVITGALKNAIGKPRPDLIDRCQPAAGSVDPPVYGLSNHSICTQTDNAILKDGFRSFPSGHSSSAWAGLFYLSLYLAAKLHVLDNRGEVWKTFIVFVPCIGAALIAGTRIMDARHHPFDVISGSLIGILVAWASYRQYFPAVSDTWKKGRAYPIRTWGTSLESRTRRSRGDARSIRRAHTDESEYSKMQDRDHSPGAVPLSPLPTAVTPQIIRTGTGNHFRDENARLDAARRGETVTMVGSSNPYVRPVFPPGDDEARRQKAVRRQADDEGWSEDSSSSAADSVSSGYERGYAARSYVTDGQGGTAVDTGYHAPGPKAAASSAT